MPEVRFEARPGYPPAATARVLPTTSQVGDGQAPSPAGPASAVVHARLREQATELARRAVEARHDVPDGVHQMRVALRRLRSALATFRPLLDSNVSEPVRSELAWIAEVLGEARDVEVMRERLAAAVAAEPAELVVGPIATRLEDYLSGRYRDAHTRAVLEMDSERYHRLLHAVQTLATDPPWTPQAGEPARLVLRRRMRNDWQRLERRVAAATRSADVEQRHERLHEARKAAKRARYTAETLEPTFGRDARRLVKGCRRVQSILGEHQDCVVTQALLRRLATQAHARGEDTFTYGLLHAHEEFLAMASEREFATAWRDTSRKNLHRWHG